MENAPGAADRLEFQIFFGFPEDAGFSLEYSHFYLDDQRYPSFCVAMQRAHERGLRGVTQQEVFADWSRDRSSAGQSELARAA